MQVRNAAGAVKITIQSDSNGAFVLSGLPGGNYRLVSSSPGFESKETLFTLGIDEAPAPLRISLAVSAVSATVEVKSRADDLVGIAASATEGIVGQAELEDRPLLRSGEVLETIPGVIITQHAGGGKANQYFLRGFNLDHGTDIAVFVDDMPLNLPSHAHGEGYADMNIVIPEFVKGVEFEKGPYYANVGNFGSAASARVEYFKTLSANFIQIEGGKYGFGRTVFGISQKLGKGNLLYGGEAYHDNGPWTVEEDNYYKFNGLMTYRQGGDEKGFSITARTYRGTWHSSDQMPVGAEALVGLYGSLDPAAGGVSNRYSLQGEWHRLATNSETKISAYGFYYDMNLFGDFTYYLHDLSKMDEFEQQDRRWVAGFDAHHTITSDWFGRMAQTTFGMQLRNDWVHNGLFRTAHRVRTDKSDSIAPDPGDPNEPNNGGYAILPAVTDLSKFTATIGSFYVENKVQWTSKFRFVLALRGDDAKYIVTALTPEAFGIDFATANSGTAAKFLPSPKLDMVFGPWNKTEFYAQGGFGFHSNDARGSTQTIEPISPEFPYPGVSCEKISPLVQTKGGEFGARTSTVPHLQSTVALWYLRSDSELQQDGNTGGTSASEQSSNRYGLEVANFYQATEHIAFDYDFSDSRAQFTQTDSADASYETTAQGSTQAVLSVPYAYASDGSGKVVISPTYASYSYAQLLPILQQAPQPGFVQNLGGKLVPEAVKVVMSAGVTLHNYKGFSGEVRMRYFGPRDLTSDGVNKSKKTLLFNAGGSYQISKTLQFSTELLNLLNSRADDITYAYVSRITSTDVARFTNVTHPTEPFQMRFSLKYRFGGEQKSN